MSEVGQITDSTNYIPQLSWEHDPGEDELYNILAQNPALFLTASSKQFRKLTQEPSLPQRRLSLPKPKSFKPYLTHYSKEKLQTFSIEDLKVLRKRKTKFISAFSISSPYIPEGLQQSSLCSVLGNLKYCSSFDAASFIMKRIRNKAFLRMRRSIFNFIRSVSQLNRGYTFKDMSLSLTRDLRELTQRVPNDLNIQRSLQCLVLDSIFPEQKRRRTTTKSLPKQKIRRVMDKIVRSQDLESLVLRKESIQNLLQNQDELQRLVENLPKLKEFVLGVDFGYRTFWAPQFQYGLASRITCLNMRYKSGSHGQDAKSPLFDFLNNIDAFANLRTFRYEESEGIHWNHPDVLQELEKLNRFQRVPLKEFYLNMFFGSQEPGFEHFITGFFQNLKLPTTTEKVVFYARFHNLALLKLAHGHIQCFEPLKALTNLKSFDLSLITDTLITDILTKEEQPGFLVHFFQQALQHLNPELQELSLTAIKSCDISSKRIFQDDQLLRTIARQFKSLTSLSLEFPPGTIDLSYTDKETPLAQLQNLSVTGFMLPLEFCQKLNPEKFASLVYNSPKGIELQDLVNYLDAVSSLTFLKQVSLVFTGCDQYDIRGEILDRIVRLFQKLSSLTALTMYLDVRVKRNVLDWLMKLANLKKGLVNCRLNFYHYGLVKPYLISKEDYWIKSHMERTRKFLMN